MRKREGAEEREGKQRRGVKRRTAMSPHLELTAGPVEATVLANAAPPSLGSKTMSLYLYLRPWALGCEALPELPGRAPCMP